MNEPILKVVSVLLIRDESVLLVRHINSKHIENIYGHPGGKLEAGETEAEAAKREIQEETALVTTLADLRELPTLWTGDVTFKNGNVRTCAMRVFLCRHYEGEIRGTKKEAPAWVPLSEVSKLPLLPNVEKAIREALRLKVP